MKTILKKLLFGNWNKWKDVSCSESLGYIIVIQTRTNIDTNKREIRKVKIWVNDTFSKREIQEKMFK